MMDTLSASDGLDRCSHHVMCVRSLRVSLFRGTASCLACRATARRPARGQESTAFLHVGDNESRSLMCLNWSFPCRVPFIGQVVAARSASLAFHSAFCTGLTVLN